MHIKNGRKSSNKKVWSFRAVIAPQAFFFVSTKRILYVCALMKVCQIVARLIGISNIG
jgi:hypothetical protein